MNKQLNYAVFQNYGENDYSQISIWVDTMEKAIEVKKEIKRKGYFVIFCKVVDTE